MQTDTDGRWHADRDGWMDGRTDGQTDRQTDRQTLGRGGLSTAAFPDPNRWAEERPTAWVKGIVFFQRPKLGGLVHVSVCGVGVSCLECVRMT